MIRTAKIYRTANKIICCDMYMSGTFYKIKQLYPHAKNELPWQFLRK